MSIIDVPRKSPWNCPMSMWQVFCTWEYTLGHFWHQPEKFYFEPSQIATVTNCDNSGILAVAICDLSQFVIKVETWHIESNNPENAFCDTWESTHVHFWHECEKKHFCPFWCYFTGIYIFACISVIMSIIDVPRKTPWNGPKSMWTCFLYLVVYHRALLTSTGEVVFWTVTNCDSHKLRHYRRNLWFVAICDQSRDGANWVQQHGKRVQCTWESTHVHFWYEYEKLQFCPFWCYFTGISGFF